MKAKLFKLNVVLLFGLVFILFFSLDLISNASSEDSKELDIHNDFAPDRVLLVLDEEYTNNMNLVHNKLIMNTNYQKIENITDRNINKSKYQLSTNNESLTHSVICLQLAKKDKQNVIDTINELKNKDGVLYAGPDYYISSSGINPNDSSVNLQYYIDKVKLRDAWGITTGSSSVSVGVIDSGIDCMHLDLAQQVDCGLSRDFTSGTEEEIDYSSNLNGHGTFVAGIIGAKGNNKIGITGVCWDVKLVSLRAFDETKAGNSSWTLKAIEYATRVGIPILNLSAIWGEGWPNYDLALKTVISQYPGLIVCASGNNETDNDGYNSNLPASYDLPNIISVGASDENDNICEFSAYGKKSVDLFAPGINIYSTLPNNSFGYDKGTSFAAPIVTGVAALLLSKYPELTATELKATILQNVDKISSLEPYCVTGGRLNAFKALQNPHTHEYKYRILTDKHIKYCECGYASEVANYHTFKKHTCTVCRSYTELHDYKSPYKWFDYTMHWGTCDCGTEGKVGHAVSSSAYDSGQMYAPCLQCGGQALIGFTQITSITNQINLYTSNGSFILPNGVIILTEEDIEMYLNGSLKFFEYRGSDFKD